MTSLLAIVTHTPTWVWAVFAALVAMGLQQMRTRDVAALRMWIVPIAMGSFSLLGAWHAFAGVGEALVVAAWLVGAAIGFASNWSLDLPRRVSANADGSFRIEGSIAPLLLFVAIFLLRYAVGATLAIAPALASNARAAMLLCMACGLPTGLLVARSRKVLSTRGTSTGLTLA